MVETVRTFLTSPIFLITWVSLDIASVIILIYDLKTKNRKLVSMMIWVWILTVIYSGPFGLAIYYYSGRPQISKDNLWKRAFRSVAHCYSGCGAGELIGVVITAGILSLNNWWVSGVTFFLAYVIGYTMTAGPMIQQQVSVKVALRDAFYSETASIVVMEVVAILVDIWLSRAVVIASPLFWSSLIFSLTMGLIAAYPVNILLISRGIKKGM